MSNLDGLALASEVLAKKLAQRDKTIKKLEKRVAELEALVGCAAGDPKRTRA